MTTLPKSLFCPRHEKKFYHWSDKHKCKNHRSAGKLLLLLALNLLLWGTSDSAHLCNGHCKLTLRDLFDHASNLSDYINIVSSDVLGAFHKKYASGEDFMSRVPRICNNSYISVSKTMKQPEVFLKRIISILGSWNQTLQHLLTELSAMEEAPEDTAPKLRYINMKSTRLLEDIKMILRKVHPGAEENEDDPDSSGLSSLPAANEDNRIYTFYSLLRCLRTDSKKVTFYVKLLRCRLVHKKNC